MGQTGSPACVVLNRRWLLRLLLAGLGAAMGGTARIARAQPATPAASMTRDLVRLFPNVRDLPAGLELENAGTREDIAQLAGTFRNSRDAAQLLAGWGWAGNAYRSYSARAGSGSATPARVEISLHQFVASIGAAYALSYFAHDRAVALRRPEGLGERLLPCEAVVTGGGSVTRFMRRGNLLVRVTVVMPSPTGADAEASALVMATELALAILANAEDSSPGRQATC